jgi:hypothetical protein
MSHRHIAHDPKTLFVVRGGWSNFILAAVLVLLCSGNKDTAAAGYQDCSESSASNASLLLLLLKLK